ncbi:hypothetical protein CLV24_105100 [Pontibacter ummariensis]|uniref:Uncharacterized protein n=1 Tax=Pontibacter ummariensis TaxID=1610492 RepID=A0A239DVN1_9BACT|nr:hypothetical protein [Pontibacter ummariensis]PRY13730.1 hypothetical protein CLV24_105100 [Pontibacter ummariensis]SNS36550.1 hypothetical protein SAMN06296052_105151 [Pontibacter ummariensis]
MKPFDELTHRQQLIRKNLARFFIHGCFALVLVWSVFRMVEKQEQANASHQRVEDTMMDFYLKTRDQTDTLGMAAYMKQHLYTAEYQLWLRMGE